MGEPPASPPPGGGALELVELLATKLHVPRTRRGLVPRPRLVDRLTEGLAGELTVVCAPAGFGKTALLADWARRSGWAVAWLSLDTGDNDPARFWRYVAAALGGVRDGVGNRVAPLLREPWPRSFEAVVTTLVNELATAPGEVALVLDDYHVIESPAVHRSLAFLVEHLPACLRLAVASRSDPPLPLARLRARGQLTEVRAAELRLTASEAAALLREAVGPGLPEDAVLALEARTEGWVAGLQLAALSLRRRPDVAGFVAAFTGSHRYVLDYLAEEVLDRQPARVRGFLLETSVLDRLCGALCDAVTGRSDGQQLLEAVDRANLFLVPLDEERGWYRYHQLFAELLRARLGQEQPERLPALHRAAGAWCEQRGLVDDAISHALAAGDGTWAARLVERHIAAILARGEGATVTRWLAALPARVVRSRPRLCTVRAAQAVIAGQAGVLEHWLDAAEQALAASVAGGPDDTAPDLPGWAAGWPPPDVRGTVMALRAHLARLRGDADRTIRLAGQVLAVVPADALVLRFAAEWNLARGHWLLGDLGEAERGLAELVPAARPAGENLTMAVCWDLGRVRCAQGRLRAAMDGYRRALAAVAETGGSSHPALGIAHLGVAAVLCERDELAGALDHAQEGVARCRQLAGTRLLAEGLAVLARIRHSLGDLAGAMAAIEEAGEVGPSPDVVDLFNPAPVERARLLLSRGQVSQVADWLAARGISPGDQPSYPREREHLLLARLLLAQGDVEPARGLLQRLHAAAAAQGRTGSLVELGAVTARALHACGQEAEALDALAETLTLAWPQGYVRVFVDEGEPVAALFGQLIARQRGGPVTPQSSVPADYLGRVAAAFSTGGRRPAPRAAAVVAHAVMPGLTETLTGREMQVLALLVAGAPNQQIADELVVALETVKKHVGHIFGKLGVANRTQAAARARELGLLR
ncbi:MAG TPA: LuxR C-terminal-related transcriptional regulator [Streptosporangiaceae bacterium]